MPHELLENTGNAGNPPVKIKKSKTNKACYSCSPRQLCTKCGRKNETCDRCAQGLVVTSTYHTMLCGLCDDETYEGYEKGVKDPYYYGVRWKLNQ